MQSEPVKNSLYQFIPVSVQMYRKIPQALIFQGLRDPNRPDIPGHQKMHLIGIEPTHAAPEATALSTELQVQLISEKYYIIREYNRQGTDLVYF